MAGRPPKEGLDYFELDCHMDQKVELIEAEFGLKGFAIVVKLLQYIYSGHGYYGEWTPDISVLWALRTGGSHSVDSGNVGRMSDIYETGVLSGFPKNYINEVVSACIKRDIFSRPLFEKYQILTSSGIQKRYFRAVSRRGEQELKKEYLLVSVGKNSINVNKNSINADNNSIIDGKNATEKRILDNNNIFSNPALSEAFDRYVKSRPQPFTGKVIDIAVRQLMKASGGDEDVALKIVERTLRNNWSGFFPLKEKKQPNGKKNNAFKNFTEREVDYNQIAGELMKTQERL